MRTETIKIYQFEEISKEAQEKAIEDTRNSNGYLNDVEWSEWLQEEFKEELEKLGILTDGFFWDLYNNNFYLDNPSIPDEKEFIKKMGFEKWLILKSLENKTEEEKEEFEDDLKAIEIVGGEYKTIIGNFQDEEIEEQINKKLKDILSGFLKRLQEEYEGLNSDESIKDFLIINDFEFNENGGRY